MAERSYSYPAKNVVRDLWMQFLYMSTFDAASAYGLYLPGAENLELPGYVERGFRPAHLIGCEHDEMFQPRVRASAGGIHVVNGNVTDGVRMVESMNWPRLRFVNLDFDGTYNTFVEEIVSVFRVFPASDEGYISVTSYSARDDDVLKQGMVNLSKFFSAMDQPSFMADIGKMFSRWRRSRRESATRIPDSFFVSREIGLLWWLAISMMVVSYQTSPYGVISHQHLGEIDTILESTTESVTDSGRGTNLYFVRDERLAEKLQALHVELWPTDLRHIMYYTRRSQPMRSWFLRVCPISLDEQVTAQELVTQIWELAVRAPLVVVDEDGAKTTYE